MTDRRRAEQEAQDLFEHSTDALATVGFDGYYRRANPALVQAFGYPADELFSRPIFDLIHPDDLEATSDAFSKVAQGEELIGFEVRHICADGSVRWFQWNARPNLDEQVIYGQGRDVTESRRAQREFEEIFSVSPDLLCIIGFDGYFKRVNPAFEQTFGYSSEELLSRPIFELNHPNDMSRSREGFERVTRGETITRFENRNIRADGTLIWLEWTAQPLPEERIVYAAARDITERKRAEAELGEAQEAVEASRAELAVYADEQAALRRVATLAAQGASPQDLFEAVAEEVGRLLPVANATMGRFEPDGSVTNVASWSTTDALAFPTGRRWPTEGTNVAWLVLQTGRTARIDDFSGATDPIGVAVRDAGIKSAVGSPIIVKGHLWGVIAAASTEGPMPPDTEARLASFTELVATAIENTESRAQLDVHVEQQAALRRVATLVAQGVSPHDLFEAVAEEVGHLLPVGTAAIGRFDPDDSVTLVASWGTTAAAFPTGSRWPAEGTSVAWTVRQTGRTARWDDSSAAAETLGDIVQKAGIKSAVGSPIVVKGHLWGVVTAASTEGPVPPDTEARLASFTELVATAISNAESRAQLDVHSEQQAALRRVATLVAEDVPPGELFEAVVREAGTLLGGDFSGIARFEHDSVVTVGVWAADGPHPPVPPGWPMQDGDPATTIARSREPARWDDWSAVPGPIADFIRGLGIQSTVGTPIVVEGRLWGALALHSKGEAPLPPDTETRMAQFTDLVGTAIANREARAEVTRLADEQAALRRVATLVAQREPSRKIIDAVAAEVVQLLGTDLAMVFRFDPDGEMSGLTATGVAASSIPLGPRLPVPPDGVTGEIRRTGRPARRDTYDDMSGIWRQVAEESGMKSVVGAPITVEGHVWGVVSVASASDRPLPADTEQRLAQFTDLVGTAIANREARAEVTRLADEQAALRRVATLVAHGDPSKTIIDAVASEVVQLLGTELAIVYRFDSDDEMTALAATGPAASAIPVGTRMPVLTQGVTGEVRRTGRPARRDDYEGISGIWGQIAEETAMSSGVGAPITVEGNIWGVICAASPGEGTLPVDTERRLAQFTDLVGTAISNTESRAALAASRARVVAATADERRRVVRDLHDGAQQRLVHAVISMKLALRDLHSPNDGAEDHLQQALTQAEQADFELHELVHGILPAALTSGGLRAGVDELASRCSLPVSTDVPEGRFPQTIEATAYFVVSEALTNVLKHADAHRAQVEAHVDDGTLLVEVRDDGVGGADPSGGSGITGLRDRVEALGGTIEISSPPGEGTSLRVRIPIP